MLLPSLLDRLTDDRPDQKSGPPRALSRAGLAERVKGELTHLLNATSLESAQDLEGFPLVAATGLNFGIRDLTGCTKSGVSVRALERSVKEAIMRHEPRLISQSVRVSCASVDRRAGAPAVRIRIEAELATSPLPERLRFSTVLSLEDGEARVEIDRATRR